jgi:hypothetical protein
MLQKYLNYFPSPKISNRGSWRAEYSAFLPPKMLQKYLNYFPSSKLSNGEDEVWDCALGSIK